MVFTDVQKAGIGVIGFGAFFVFFGCTLFFDRALLAMGNVFLVLGTILFSGLRPTIRFGLSPGRRIGFVTFIAGVALVLAGWPITGFLTELFGFVNLYGSYFPAVVRFLRRLPLIGLVLNLPGLSYVTNMIAGSS